MNFQRFIIKRHVFKLMTEEIASLKKKRKDESKREINIQRKTKKSKRKREKSPKITKISLI